MGLERHVGLFVYVNEHRRFFFLFSQTSVCLLIVGADVIVTPDHRHTALGRTPLDE